ncbi:MAG TPA: hypothetical protein VIL88_02535 [Devosia sp.]|jgi:hypothetical protein
MIALFELETSQSEGGSIYRVRVGCFLHPKVVAMMLALTRWL